MRIVYITAGAGRMACDICLRDGALARAILAQDHDVLFVPTYTPAPAGNRSIAVHELFYGGINVFLQQKFSLFRHTPRLLDRLFDSGWLLDFASRFGHLTEARDLARMTISMLEGEAGHQRKEMHRLLEFLAAQPRPDVVVLPNSLFAGLAEPLRRQLGAPVICLLSGEDSFVEQFPEPWRAQARDLLRQRCAQMDGFMVSSRAYADFMTDYLALPPGKVRPVTAGIDVRPYLDLPAERQAPERFTIGFRSQVWPANGLHQLVEAFRQLKANPATAACRLRVAGFIEAGDRPYFHELEAKIRTWGLAEDFEYVGEVDAAARVPFLAGLSAICVPVEYPEPTGLFVPEALAAGVPVVLPRTGCLPEWVEATGGGLLTDSTAPEALTEALGRLMLEPGLAAALGRAGREAILARHTMPHVAASALAALADFVAAAPPATHAQPVA